MRWKTFHLGLSRPVFWQSHIIFPGWVGMLTAYLDVMRCGQMKWDIRNAISIKTDMVSDNKRPWSWLCSSRVANSSSIRLVMHRRRLLRFVWLLLFPDLYFPFWNKAKWDSKLNHCAIWPCKRQNIWFPRSPVRFLTGGSATWLRAALSDNLTGSGLTSYALSLGNWGQSPLEGGYCHVYKVAWVW
jgi:hypothetical protein